MRPDGLRSINPWMTATAVMFGTFMVFLDTTVVNLSLPYMAGNLSSTISESTWVLTSYLAANAVILPITGWLANYVGRKRLILVGLSGFTIASLACGLAPSLGLLVSFRIVQGLCGGVLQPLSLAVMLESFPPRLRGQAMGLWSVGIVLAPVLGPVVGGYLTYNFSWRWVFLINIPVGIVAVIMTLAFVFDPVYIRRRSEHIDYIGIGLLVLGIACLQIMLDKGQEEDWFASRLIVSLLAVGAVAMVVFVVRAIRVPDPLVDLRVFKDPTFSSGTLLSALVGFVFYGSVVIMPLLLQTQLDYPPLKAGLVVAPRPLGAMLAFPLIGWATSRVDPRKLFLIGLVLGAATMFWFAQMNLDLGYYDLLWPQLLQGIALGLLFIPLTTLTMEPIANEAMGNATSLFNVLRNFGSSIGIAMVATFLVRGQIRHGKVLSEHLHEYNPLVRTRLDELREMFLAAGDDPLTAAERAQANLASLVESQAGILTYLDSFRLFGWMLIAMIPLVFIMRRPVRQAIEPRVPEEHGHSVESRPPG